MTFWLESVQCLELRVVVVRDAGIKLEGAYVSYLLALCLTASCSCKRQVYKARCAGRAAEKRFLYHIVF